MPAPAPLLLSFLAAVTAVANPPSFLAILVDDYGYGDLGANGYNAETPNLDALAANGIRFLDFHSNSVCTPSRAALQTGRYNIRAGIHGNFDVDSKGGLALGEITVADILKRANYSTFMLGKHHLGHQPGYHPTWRGYDSYHGVPYSVDMGCTNTAMNEQGGLKPPGCPTSGPGNSPAIPLYNATAPRCTGVSCNAEIVQQPVDLTHLDDFYADSAAQFFAKHGPGGALSGTPFFAYVPFSHVHVPLSHNPKFTNASVRRTLFADTLLEMDDTVGRIVASLKQNGLLDNTLIIVVGDNGVWNAYVSYIFANASQASTQSPKILISTQPPMGPLT